jgi:hypothetical protein
MGRVSLNICQRFHHRLPAKSRLADQDYYTGNPTAHRDIQHTILISFSRRLSAEAVAWSAKSTKKRLSASRDRLKPMTINLSTGDKSNDAVANRVMTMTQQSSPVIQPREQRYRFLWRLFMGFRKHIILNGIERQSLHPMINLYKHVIVSTTVVTIAIY